jgi:DNA-binding PadR family transcriptional regulator
MKRLVDRPRYYALRYYATRSIMFGMSDRPKTPKIGNSRPNDPSLLILTSLASGPKHGYALSRDIEIFAGVKLGPGTLYGAISRLEERGLIEAMTADGRSRPYRLTASGQSSLERTLADLRTIVNEGSQRLRHLPRPVKGRLARTGGLA